jgi:hypothetical protein
MAEIDLLRVLKQYRLAQLPLLDLEDWLSSREQYWASLPDISPERQAVDSIMLAIYELQAGDRDEQSVATIAESALKELEAAQRV